MHHPDAKEFSDAQLRLLFALDPEVIDIEERDGKIYPVVRAYDNMSRQLCFFCIHCNDYHYHGRGGPEAPFQLGRGGNAGHRVAHCTAGNSPFLQRGYILDVVEKKEEMPKHKKRRGNFRCDNCGRQYSAAFNTCSCGFTRATNQNNPYNQLSELYRNIYKFSYSCGDINVTQNGINNGTVAGILQTVQSGHCKPVDDTSEE